MNCKPGQLAVIVKSVAGNEGKIVRCIRFIGKVDGWVGDDRWEIDCTLIGLRGARTRSVQDSYLRPIRDPGDDAVDESAAWLPPVPLPAIDPEMIPVKEKAC
jgi:hypothetical protein